jgi:DNA-binding NarL/FixJ family response regulator
MVIDPTIVARLFARKRRADPLEGLTEREREALALIAERLSNRAIATACSSLNGPGLAARWRPGTGGGMAS